MSISKKSKNSYKYKTNILSKSKKNSSSKKHLNKYRINSIKTKKMKGGAMDPHNSTRPNIKILKTDDNVLNNVDLNNLLILEKKIKIILELYKVNYSIIIILGANSSEKHIIDFVNLKTNSIVICFANIEIEKTDAETQQKTAMYINENKNTCSISFVADFNNIEVWQTLQDNFKITEIICDWSVAKFLNKEYNFINGKIMGIIFDILKITGKYYSECCFDSSTIIETKAKKTITFKTILPTFKTIPHTFKNIPWTYKYVYVPLYNFPNFSNFNKKPINKKNNKVAKSWNVLLPREKTQASAIQSTKNSKYIDKYKDQLKSDIPVNFEIEFVTCKKDVIYPLINDNIQTPYTYPLINDKRQTPYTYFVITKKTDS